VIHYVRTLIALAAIAMLAGCQTVGGWFSTGGDEEEPAELVEFPPSLEVREVWSADAGRGITRSRQNFRPFYSNGEIWVGDADGRISVIDADNGKTLRRFDTDLELSAGPAVYGSRVLVGTFNGTVVALTRETGNSLWTAELSSEVLSYPVLHDGIVIARSIDGRTFGFDVADGQREWIHDKSVPLLTLRGQGDPLPRAGQVYIGHDNGQTTGLRVSDGRVIWDQRISEGEGRTELDRMADIDGPMAIVGTNLYVASFHGRLASMAIESGRLLWVRDIASSSGLSLQRTDIALTDRNDTVFVIDRRNGSTVWSDDRLVRRELTRPVFHGSHVVVADAQGYLHWYNRDSGEFAARARATRSVPSAAPLVIGDTLYLLDVDGTLSAWRANE
jgi:outer membrane protein assembly factor BamB